MNYTNILVTGSVAFDEIMDFPGQFIDHFNPEKLHQINVSFLVDRLEKQIGGIATNIIYNLNLLIKDKEKAILLGTVGKDGNIFIEWMKKNKFNCQGIKKYEDCYTASGKVITDKKDNQIWGFYYGALEKGKNIDLKKHTKKNNVLVISANHPLAFMNFQKQAIKLKIDYLYDPGMALTWINDQNLQEGINHCKWLVGNDYEIGQIFKRLNLTVDDLKKKRIALITTLGEKGVKYEDWDNEYFVKGYKVKNVVDPTGAGDAWRGGFISGIVEGKSIVESLKLGNAIASFAVEKYGTINHRPSKKEITQRVKML